MTRLLVLGVGSIRSVWCVVAIASLALVVRPAAAQRSTRTNTARVTLPLLGEVVSTTGVVAGNRDNGGNVFASTTVHSTTNGSYALQARLTVPFTDKNKPSVVNDVRALNPLTNTYQSLSTTTWVTVAIGTSGINKLNNISLYVNWGKNSSKDLKQIPAIQLTYQFISN